MATCIRGDAYQGMQMDPILKSLYFQPGGRCKLPASSLLVGRELFVGGRVWRITSLLVASAMAANIQGRIEAIK